MDAGILFLYLAVYTSKYAGASIMNIYCLLRKMYTITRLYRDCKLFERYSVTHPETIYSTGSSYLLIEPIKFCFYFKYIRISLYIFIIYVVHIYVGCVYM